jgi:DNA polymerase I-like protein with 3'-5' exonuclease and polymerase domains
MRLITLDAETYYDQQYSLSKLTTEEYIRSDLFEVIGVSAQIDDGEPEWFSGTHAEIKNWCQQFDWTNSMLVAHNAAFDAAILSWHFDIHPKAIADTLSMARAIHGVEVGLSLAKLAEHHRLGAKGTEVINARGKRRLDFSPHELARYAEYCRNDVALTYELFQILIDIYPRDELRLIDQTLRMFTAPVLELDAFLLEKHLSDVRARKDELLAKLGGDPESARKRIMSNPQFAELLQEYGAIPPTKISPTTGKTTYAFAKTDEGMKELLAHPNPEVQALVSARLGVKSTLEETRTQRFLDIAQRGNLPVPLKYYGAPTARWAGFDKINLQNLPSRGEDAGALKHAIKPPPGYVIIDADSSQIEARILAWLSEQEDLVELFRKNNAEIAAGVAKENMQFDPYKTMASAIYRKPAEKISSSERFVGKSTLLGCFGPDTQVLTPTGWKSIVDVRITDMVWDGEAWVSHQGVIPQGEKEVVTAYGVSATADHEILTEHGWREWSEVAINPTLFQSAIGRGRLPSSIGRNTSPPMVDPLGGTRSSVVSAGGKAGLIGAALKGGALFGVVRALGLQVSPLAKSIGATKPYSRSMTIVCGYLTALRVASGAAITKLTRSTTITGGAAFQFTNHGAPTGKVFCGTYLPLRGGTTQKRNSTASTIIGGMNRVTCGLLHTVKIWLTVGQPKRSKQKLMTYDIALAGPKNRYTVATTAGPVIVHNCGYGMGAKKFQLFMQMANIEMSFDEAKHIIDTYRHTYPCIPALWAQGDAALRAMIDSRSAPYGREGVLQINGLLGVLGPNGIPRRYHELRRTRDAKGNEAIVYTSRTGITGIWGGKFTENSCQYLARVVIGQQMLRIAKRYRVVLTVHDAIACIAPEEEAQEAQTYVESCMRWVPEWASGLPLNCESGMGRSYGEC